MTVLVDSSVWIEFFRSKPRLSREAFRTLRALVEHDQAVTILPIEVEVLSGQISPKVERIVREAFGALRHVDLDWNEPLTWQRLVVLGRAARVSALPVPGVVDRMILAAAEEAGASIWTLDVAIQRLAEEQEIPIHRAG